jgi:hypothetical protein
VHLSLVCAWPNKVGEGCTEVEMQCEYAQSELPFRPQAFLRGAAATWSASDVQWDGYHCKVIQPTDASIQPASVSTSPAQPGSLQACQVEGCTSPLLHLKNYYRQHRICEQHCRQESLLVAGIRQRFCQQCGRFETLDMFDAQKRTCRIRLEKHNLRRKRARAASLTALLSGVHTTPPSCCCSRGESCRLLDLGFQSPQLSGGLKHPAPLAPVLLHNSPLQR